MARFIIKRHGSNAANQSRTLVMVLGTVEAGDSDGAKRKASMIWTCYNNQFFEAIDLAGRTRKEDREAAADADALREYEDMQADLGKHAPFNLNG
jgi:hypothetical protein